HINTPHFLFFFNDLAPHAIYTLSLHDALPISWSAIVTWFESASPQNSLPRTSKRSVSEATCGAEEISIAGADASVAVRIMDDTRSEEHTSELQSRFDLVCRLLLEKKKRKKHTKTIDSKKNTTENQINTIKTKHATTHLSDIASNDAHTNHTHQTYSTHSSRVASTP